MSRYTMDSVSIREIMHCFIDKQVIVRGWVEKCQTFKRHAIIVVRDGAENNDRIQVVTPLACSYQQEDYVEVTGKVAELPVGKYSYKPFEIQATGIGVISFAKNDFPSICPPDAGSEVRLEQRHIYMRDPTFAAYTALRSYFVQAIRSHFKRSQCTEIFPPSFVGNQCEGGATLFKLKYPARDTGDVDAYLTQSSQFYLEMAVPAVGDCYCIAPSFRAERSHTRRHLTEFLHAEAEWKNVFTLADHERKLRELLTGIISRFAMKARFLLSQIGKHERVAKLQTMVSDIVLLDHADAIKYCRDHGIYKDDALKTHFGDRDDIPEAQERRMIDEIGKVVFLRRFPKEFKSFYMASDPADPSLVLGVDVEVPGVGEVIGSGVRVSKEDELVSRLREAGLKPDEYREYIELRRYGHGRTSGMGLGVDRFLCWVLDLHSIRDVVTFPRYPGRLTP